ncbi:MAG: hypothetical protein LBC12_00080 [Nitrososphaerota archaeon]|jgi:arsenical pump membrane protein|nr:hypothetical protein [Nitrososphaerota archaeon]
MIAVNLTKPRLKFLRITLNTYWLTALLGAGLLLAFQFISLNEVFKGLTIDTAINPLKILILFLSMTAMSIFLDETGFFRYLANTVLKRTENNQLTIFTVFYLTISILTVFTSNDIIILIFTPFICYFTKTAKINPIPYLISEFVAANTASMLLIIGNPTNIYLATSNGINFMNYLTVMTLPTIFASVTAYFVMLLLFFKKLGQPISRVTKESKVENKFLLTIGLVLLSTCTGMLAVSSYIHLEMWLIAFACFASLILVLLLFSLLKRRLTNELLQTFKRMPWEIIPFIISMFAMVLALEKGGVTVMMSELFGDTALIFVYGAVSTVFANLINNIPMSVMFSSVLANLNPIVGIQAVYATIIGSNIGAYLTPVGALAGIMWFSILKKNSIALNFTQFIKYGVIIAVPTLCAALLGLIFVTLR